MVMESWELLVIFIATLIGSYLSGIAGAGGGFIMMPVLIAFGASPAQAVATQKIGGLFVTLGSLGGLRKATSSVTRVKVFGVVLLAFITGLIAPYVIINLDGEFYRYALGISILAMIPFVLHKKIGRQHYAPSKIQTAGGTLLLSIALLLQGIFSSGLGMLANLVLMSFLGMDATEANLTKRWAQLMLYVTVVVGLLTSGLILWELAVVIIPAAIIGSYAGAKLAVKKGNAFIMNVIVVLMVLSGLYLLFG